MTWEPRKNLLGWTDYNIQSYIVILENTWLLWQEPCLPRLFVREDTLAADLWIQVCCLSSGITLAVSYNSLHTLYQFDLSAMATTSFTARGWETFNFLLCSLHTKDGTDAKKVERKVLSASRKINLQPHLLLCPLLASSSGSMLEAGRFPSLTADEEAVGVDWECFKCYASRLQTWVWHRDACVRSSWAELGLVRVQEGRCLRTPRSMLPGDV